MATVQPKDATKTLLTAFLKAQAEFAPVPRDGRNAHLNNRYATLNSVQETAFPVLHKHGLVVTQTVRTELTERGPVVHIGAALWHADSAECIAQELALLPVKSDPQGIGSAISYGRRYVLLTLLGLSADDDDGQGAGQPAPQRPAQQYTPQRPPAKQAAPPPRDDRLPDEDFGDQSADNAPITSTMEKTLHASLGELYRGMSTTEIAEKRHALVKWVTGGRTESSKQLTMGEAMRLIEVIGEKLRALRPQTAAQPALVTPPSTLEQVGIN